ncbi:MAG: hypothetical protein NXI22_12355 [bacterium]|nr:hypothetical protein [bacterium]
MGIGEKAAGAPIAEDFITPFGKEEPAGGDSQGEDRDDRDRSDLKSRTW